MLKKAVLLLIAVAFLLVSSLGFAAEKKAKKWYVSKNCKVEQAATPKDPVAGPFETKEEATKAKADNPKCQKKKPAAK
jgi:hypothetical protein